MGDLKGTFDGSRLSTSANRIADVALKHDYTIIADPMHTEAAPYELLAKRETMHELSSVGVKHIAIEALTPADKPLLEAYASGRISDRTMEYAIKKMDMPSLVEDGLGKDATHQKNAYFDLVRNAKEEGIKVHGVNGSEGLLPPEQADMYHDIIGRAKLSTALAIENTPGYFDMSRREQGIFVTQNLYRNGFNDKEVIASLESMSFRKQEFIDLQDEESVKKFYMDRISADPQVAKNIQVVTGGEKTVVIYGQGHFLRPQGDIDDSLPNSAVIDVYKDKAEYTRIMGPMHEAIGKELGLDFSDKADFELDIKTGRWTNNGTGGMARVEIPHLPSVPEFAGMDPLTPPQQAPQSQALPEIKF